MDYKILDVKEQVLEENERIAAKTREALRCSGTVLINLMGSPGAGKTSVLLQIIKRLGKTYRIGVMEADVDSDMDARTVAEAGARVVQLHTGGLCHMDAAMTAQGLEALGVLPAQKPPLLAGHNSPGDCCGFHCQYDGSAGATGILSQGDRRSSGGGGVVPTFDVVPSSGGGGVVPSLDIVFLENVGNLVCPAEFDVGADLRMMILSVPEGDDKPLKYPLMFTVSDVMLVNKIDTAPIFDFDLEAAASRARALNPKIEIFPVSAKTGEGLDVVAAFLQARLRNKPAGADAHIGPSSPKGGSAE